MTVTLNMYRRRAVGLREAARETGLSVEILTDRVSRGMTVEEAVDLGMGETHRAWSFTRKNGERLGHLSLVSAALENLVPVSRIVEELEEGYAAGIGLEAAVVRAKERPCKMPRKGTLSLGPFLVGLSFPTFYRRLKRMSEREALLAPSAVRAPRTVLTVSDLAHDMLLDPVEMGKRMGALKAQRAKEGETVGVAKHLLGVKALEGVPVGEPTRAGHVNLKALAESVGIHPDTLRQRLRNGWELQDALETPPSARGRGAHVRSPPIRAEEKSVVKRDGKQAQS